MESKPHRGGISPSSKKGYNRRDMVWGGVRCEIKFVGLLRVDISCLILKKRIKIMANATLLIRWHSLLKGYYLFLLVFLFLVIITAVIIIVMLFSLLPFLPILLVIVIAAAVVIIISFIFDQNTVYTLN